MPNPGFNEPKLPEGLRAFDDAEAVRKGIYDGVLESLGKKFPISDGVHRLELTDLKYASPQEFPLSAQKKAIMSNRNLSTQLTGKWRLIDEATGGVLDEKEDTVMHVPYYTDRGTIINRGSEYSITNQARLRPGVYTRTKQSGEHEAHFNILPGTGKTFRVWMEPATGVFRVNVGQANIPAHQFFSILGIPDDEMKKAWGEELFDVNKDKVDRQALGKLYERFAGSKVNPDATDQEKEEYLKTTIPQYQVDEAVVHRTMGLPKTTTVTPQLLMRSTQKLLNISRGEEEEDNREAPQYSDYYSPDDFIKERIDKDAGHVARGLLFKVRRDRSLKRIGHAPLNSYIQSLVLGSGLASTLEETNPLQTLDQQHRIIKLGEGGIGSAESVIDEARDVHANQAGFIDPVSGPESEKCGIDMRAAYRTFKGPNKQIYGEFTDQQGKPLYMTPLEAADKVVAFPGQDPKTPEVYAVRKGKMDRVPSSEVDAWIPSNSHMYAPTVNVTPMGTGYMPTRAFFSSKYQTQFLPVVGGESPLVQAAVPDGSGRSFSEYYGRKVGCLNSKVDGIVTKVTDDGVSITDKDGKKHFVEMTKDMPFNRLTALTYKPAVHEGDLVKSGDMLATSNFTDDQGHLSMGRNLKTAVVPFRGNSYEDAYVISESAARKLTTERLYAVDKEARHGVQISRNRFISAFPSQYTRDQVENIGDDGVVKVGTTVNKGDPIVLAVGPKALSTADAQLGRLHKALRNSFRNEAQEWEYASPGIVTDVGRTTTGVKVNVKAQMPVQTGDKLSNAAASKGVVGLIVPDADMPKDNETGEPYEMLLNPMVVLSRVAPNQLVEMQLAKVAKKTGKPYILPDTPPEEGWAEFAQNELKKNGLTPTKALYDPTTGSLVPPVGDGYMYVSAFHHLAEKKLCVSADTEILTKRGWLPAPDVRADDLLATFNPATGETEYRPPTIMVDYEIRHPERLIRVTGNNRDELVTSKHKVYIDGELVLAEDLLELVSCP